MTGMKNGAVTSKKAPKGASNKAKIKVDKSF
jgi:hypothetical protein